MKTLPPSKFGGRLTLGEVEKIAPDAIWRLDISADATRSAFSHNLIWTPPDRQADSHVMSRRRYRLQSYIRPCHASRSLRALMEFAKNVLISVTRCRRTAVFRFAFSRSDLLAITVESTSATNRRIYCLFSRLRWPHAHVVPLVLLTSRQNRPRSSSNLASQSDCRYVGRSSRLYGCLPGRWHLGVVQH